MRSESAVGTRAAGEQMLRDEILYLYDQHMTFGGVAMLGALAAAIFGGIAVFSSALFWSTSWTIGLVATFSLTLCAGTISMTAYFAQDRVQARLDLLSQKSALPQRATTDDFAGR